MSSPALGARTDPRRYGRVAILLHWLSAACVLGLIAMGLAMTHAGLSPLRQFQLYQWHKSVGVTVLLLSLARLGWRLFKPPPALPAGLPGWERRAATATHRLLYALLLALPLTGWAVVSASPFDIPTMLYGLVPWPHLPILPGLSDKAAAEAVLGRIHAYGAYGLIALLALHVAAALRHHLILRDDTLRRMLPGVRQSAAAASPPPSPP